MRPEGKIEDRLVTELGKWGMQVVKLTCPGTAGVPDRMILRPTWSPGPPWFVECKAPGKSERRLQELVRDNWRARGMLILDKCDSLERMWEIVQQCSDICCAERIDGK